VQLVGRDFAGGITRNMFTYEVTEPIIGDGTDNAMRDMAAGFWTSISTELRDITAIAHEYTEVLIKQLDGDDLLPFFEDSWPIPPGERAGQQGVGEAMPPFVTWTYKIVRPDTSFRHGYKRFAGVSETDVNGDAATGTALVKLNALATALELPIVAADHTDLTTPLDNPANAELRLVTRVRNGEPVSPVITGAPAGVIFNGVGSQASRKAGRGE
jgi:hypothetical protein